MAVDAGQRRILTMVRPHINTAVAFSLAINILFLVSPLYMLQVYDRVLTTGSVATLILLSMIAVFLLVIYLFAEAGRRRVLARAGETLSRELSEDSLRRGFRDPRVSANDTLTAVGQLSTVQQALGQGLPAALFDLPFVPFFLAILFVVHPALGLVGLFGAAALVALAVFTERTTKEPLGDAAKADRAAQNELRQLVRQRGAIVGMGMADRAVGRWTKLRERGVEASLRAGLPATFLGAATRSLRMILQIAILGSGAFLAVQGTVSPGAIIAASIIMGRALAPIDQTVNSWRQMMAALTAFRELGSWAGEAQERREVTPLPRPEPAVRFDELAIGIPGAERPLLPPMVHDFGAGQIVVVLGQSGAGKTSTLQTLAAAWPAHSGCAKLGARDLDRWDPADRGRYIGYLPQHVELLRGTVRENISRFTDAPPEAVFEAARTVGAHDLILSLPDGYDTEIGEGGTHLSAGQRQAIGLARAFFGNPALLILDEPTAHLDSGLAAHLMQVFARLAQTPKEERGVTAFVATHDLRLLNAADDVMLIRDRTVAVTSREKYLSQISELKRSRAASQQKPAALAQPEAQRSTDNA